MRVSNGHGLTGPFKSEQEFKMAWISKMQDRAMTGTVYFCVETEETIPGFPDVMKLTYQNNASFYEMKLADKNDKFTLQRSQPLFYRHHDSMQVSVLVWSNNRNKLFCISSKEISDMVLRKETLTLCLSDFKEE